MDRFDVYCTWHTGQYCHGGNRCLLRELRPVFIYPRFSGLSSGAQSKSKKYIAALGIKTKTDKVDAKALGRMGAEQALERWQPMGAFFYQLRSLTRHNQSLKEMRTALGNQLEAARACMYADKATIKSLTALIKTLEAQIKHSGCAITTHLHANEEVAKKVANITAIKGVGELSVAVIVGETNGFELFGSSSQLVSYAGYDVVENQSGKHSGRTKISKKGNSRIRRALHMPSLCLVTHKVKIFKDLYERTLVRHGIKMKSYVAVQKKLLHIIYTLWKRNEIFDDNYGSGSTTKDEEAVLSSRHSFAEAE